MTVGGTKYMVIMADERYIYGKKGAGGVVLAKTGKTVLVGVYSGERLATNQVVLIVQRLADSVMENGY